MPSKYNRDSLKKASAEERLAKPLKRTSWSSYQGMAKAKEERELLNDVLCVMVKLDKFNHDCVLNYKEMATLIRGKLAFMVLTFFYRTKRIQFSLWSTFGLPQKRLQYL